MLCDVSICPAAYSEGSKDKIAVSFWTREREREKECVWKREKGKRYPARQWGHNPLCSAQSDFEALVL